MSAGTSPIYYLGRAVLPPDYTPEADSWLGRQIGLHDAQVAAAGGDTCLAAYLKRHGGADDFHAAPDLAQTIRAIARWLHGRELHDQRPGMLQLTNRLRREADDLEFWAETHPPAPAPEPIDPAAGPAEAAAARRLDERRRERIFRRSADRTTPGVEC